MIEADKVKPNRLQDILFTGTGKKKGDNYKFGPVVANYIKIWKTVVFERRIGGHLPNSVTVHLYGTIELCMWKSSICPTLLVLFRCEPCGEVYVLIKQGPLFISGIESQICLPASAYFVFLQLRSALKAYGVPWSSFPFPLILCGTGLHHLLVGHLFP